MKSHDKINRNKNLQEIYGKLGQKTKRVQIREISQYNSIAIKIKKKENQVVFPDILLVEKRVVKLTIKQSKQSGKENTIKHYGFVSITSTFNLLAKLEQHRSFDS
ncbi:unnamed protein product (macronuclear) [Paramecium tetraurelia]|uniref:Uncharacterized protein n=1 Tax=Paramecium tetraurelia TaxID=5888 RepID=A0BF20_PARTE|nr:uncharacterized protein GSPATT00028172001 [Paramecium tetraurelia]CAK57137.1 unnamed protein product [Paramecium tetraurelia]|eukprot:XP_001424535.1 hypothetical protein (macronuclear) [Paramecium tetraurelia strain d4-2]